MPPGPEAVIQAFRLLERAGYRAPDDGSTERRARLFLTWTVAFIDLGDEALLQAVHAWLAAGPRDGWPAPGNVRALLSGGRRAGCTAGARPMSDALRQSLAAGPHALLARLVGAWEGEVTTCFEPGVLADRSPWSGRARALLGGRLVELTYDSSLGGRPLSGHALLAHHLQRGCFEAAWADTFHTGTQLMHLTGVGPDGGLQVLGSYPAGEGPDWGWRLRVALPSPDLLVLAMDNVPPGEPPAEAVVVEARRVGG